MTDLLYHEIGRILAVRNIDQAFAVLMNTHSVMTEETIEEVLQREGLASPSEILSTMQKVGVLGSTPDGYYLTTFGRRTGILLRAMYGRLPVDEVIRQLQMLYPYARPYTLLTEGIVDSFFDSLEGRPDFIRLHICSPWVRLTQKLRRQLRSALAKAHDAYPGAIELVVIMRPPVGASAWLDDVRESCHLLRGLGATIYYNKRIHAKLYIRQPGPRGGLQSAIFGSENLTGVGNVELGIRIDNDSDILQKLDLLFLSIQAESILAGGVG
jgi:hypothetical protein